MHVMHFRAINEQSTGEEPNNWTQVKPIRKSKGTMDVVNLPRIKINIRVNKIILNGQDQQGNWSFISSDCEWRKDGGGGGRGSSSEGASSSSNTGNRESRKEKAKHRKMMLGKSAKRAKRGSKTRYGKIPTVK